MSVKKKGMVRKVGTNLIQLLAFGGILFAFAETDVGGVLGGPWVIGISLAVIASMWGVIYWLWREENRRNTLSVIFMALYLAAAAASPVLADDPSPPPSLSEEEKLNAAYSEFAGKYQDSGINMVCDACRKIKSGASAGNSWVADVFIILYDATNVLATSLFNYISGSMLQLLALGACITIAVTVFKMFIPVADIGTDYIKNLANFLFKVMLAAILLTYISDAFSLLVEPIILMFVTTAGVIVGGEGAAAPVTFPPEPAGGGMMRPDAKVIVATIIQGIHDEIRRGMAIAKTLICLGWYKNPSPLKMLGFRPPSIPMCLMGTTMLLGYLVLLIMYHMTIIDAMVRMMFVIAFFPIFVLLWVFKITVGYVKTAFDIILNACATFLFSAIIVKIILIMYGVALGSEPGEDMSDFANKLFSTCEIAGGSVKDEAGFQAMETLIMGDGGASRMLMLILVAFAAWKALSSVDKMVGKLGVETISFQSDGDVSLPSMIFPTFIAPAATGVLAKAANKIGNATLFTRKVFEGYQRAAYNSKVHVTAPWALFQKPKGFKYDPNFFKGGKMLTLNAFLDLGEGERIERDKLRLRLARDQDSPERGKLTKERQKYEKGMKGFNNDKVNVWANNRSFGGLAAVGLFMAVYWWYKAPKLYRDVRYQSAGYVNGIDDWLHSRAVRKRAKRIKKIMKRNKQLLRSHETPQNEQNRQRPEHSRQLRSQNRPDAPQLALS